MLTVARVYKRIVLTPSGANLVLWVHILAACVWIGGQIVLAMLVPLLRRDRAILAAAGRRYQLVAWAAFAVLIATGLGNMANAGISSHDLTTTPTGRTLTVKLGFVALSGVAAALHAFVVAPRAGERPTSVLRAASGILGVVALLAAMLAALYGVLIAEA